MRSPVSSWFSPTALGLVLVLVLTACAPAAPPSPTAAPPKPAATTAPAPAPTAAPAAAPTSAPAPTAAPKPAATTAPAAAKPTEGPIVQINGGLVSNIQNLAPWVGLEKGIYLKHGIDLKLKLFNSGTETLKAAQVGETQFGAMAFGSLATARSQGIKVKAITLIVSDATAALRDDQIAIVAHPKSGITKVADLVGKRIGTTTGVAPDFYLKAVLAKAGIPGNKVELVNIQPPNMLSTIGSGVDAIVAVEPYPEQILAKIPGTVVVSRGGGYIAQRPVLVSMEDWLAANRPVAERLGAATAESMQFVRKNPDEAADISVRWLTGVEAPILRKAVRYLAMDPRMSKAVREGWQSEVGAIVERGALKAMVPFDESVDAPLMEAVTAKYPQFVSDLKPAP